MKILIKRQGKKFLISFPLSSGIEQIVSDKLPNLNVVMGMLDKKISSTKVSETRTAIVKEYYSGTNPVAVKIYDKIKDVYEIEIF